MAITLGKDGAAPPFGVDIISATFTEECEVIDVTNRTNEGGATGAAACGCGGSAYGTCGRACASGGKRAWPFILVTAIFIA